LIPVHFRPFLPRNFLQRPGFAAYFLAIALTVLTLYLRNQASFLIQGPALVIFILPIMLSAYIGGIGPGLLATLLAAAESEWLLRQTVDRFTASPNVDLFYLSVLTLSGIGISMLSERSLATLRQRATTLSRVTTLAHLVDSADDSIVSTTVLGIVTHWNRGAEAMFGYSAEDMLGRSIFQLFPRESMTEEAAIMERVAKGVHIPPYKAQRIGKNGQVTDISITVSGIRDDSGNIIGLSRIAGNISHYKRIDDARLAAEAKFRALVELSLTGVFILQDSKIVYVNQAVADIFGYASNEDMLDRHLLEFIENEQHSPEAIRRETERPDQGLTTQHTFTGKRRDGSPIVVRVFDRMTIHEGRPAIIGSLMDITESHMRNQALAHQVEEKTALLHQREQDLHTILDNMPALISYYDLDLRHRFGNQAYCSWHDVDRECLTKTRLPDITSPEQFARVEPRLRMAMQGTPQLFEHIMWPDKPNGGWAAQVHLIPDRQEGQVNGLFCLIMDVSPLKAAEGALSESEARFRQLFESAPVGISLYRQDGQCIMANQALAELVGGTRAQLEAQNFRQLEAWQRSGMARIAQMALDNGERQRYEVTLESSFGRLLEIECEFALPDIQGERYLMLLVKDISPFRQAAALIQQTMKAELDRARLDHRYRQVVENMTDGFFAADFNGILLEVNDVYVRLSGYSRNELIGMHISELDANHTVKDVRARLEQIRLAGNQRFETRLRRKDGSTWPCDLSAAYTRADGGKIYAFARDITEMKRAEEEIRRLAFFDSLTALPNRQLLLDRLNQALISCRRSRQYGALLFIDLDNFKQLNDTLGHDMGDRLLVAVARRLQSCVRVKDTVARLGGDEFIIMLEGLDPVRERAASDVRSMAETILSTLNQPYHLDRVEYENTPSIGIALFCENDTTVEELLKHADLAMYQAKSVGRNTLCFFDPQTQSLVESRSLLENELRQALRLNQLRLHFQPQVDRTGRMIGAEALVRWQHPEKGLMAPGHFIDMAEESGLVHVLGLQVLELSCQQLQRWKSNPALGKLSLAVNVSARQFRHPDFVPQIRDLLQRYGVNGANLKLELTESMLLHDIRETALKIVELKGLGLAFSLDDFGTGYSSLSYLKSLPLEELKIDQSFVRDILTDPNNAAIVRAIIGMGHSLGLKIVAEGVETAEQWLILMSEGCDFGQGYFFSRPLPSGEFEARYSHHAMPRALHAPRPGITTDLQDKQAFC